MPSGSRFALAALLVLATLCAVLAPVGATDGDAGAVGAGGHAIAASSPEASASPTAHAVGGAQIDGQEQFRSNSTIEIQLRPNGDARISVTVFRTNLTTQAERDVFQDVAADHEAGRTVSRTMSAIRQASVEASETTGRQMSIRDVDPSADIVERQGGNATGMFGLSVTWTNFARSTDGRLVVDDVFETRSQTWLQVLAPGQRLVIRPPEGYDPVTTDNGALRDRTFYRNGPATFTADRHPSVVFSGNPWPTPQFLGLALGGLFVVLAVGYVLVRRRGSPDGGDSGEAPTAAAGSSGSGEGQSAPAESASAPTNGAGEDEVDVELLSDEERVERLLEQNGGRMKQASIVKETGWSNAKVSQLLSSMEEDELIDKLRIGRENLISFPDEDVADVEE